MNELYAMIAMFNLASSVACFIAWAATGRNRPLFLAVSNAIFFGLMASMAVS